MFPQVKEHTSHLSLQLPEGNFHMGRSFKLKTLIANYFQVGVPALCLDLRGAG